MVARINTNCIVIRVLRIHFKHNTCYNCIVIRVLIRILQHMLQLHSNTSIDKNTTTHYCHQRHNNFNNVVCCFNFMFDTAVACRQYQLALAIKTKPTTTIHTIEMLKILFYFFFYIYYLFFQFLFQFYFIIFQLYCAIIFFYTFYIIFILLNYYFNYLLQQQSYCGLPDLFANAVPLQPRIDSRFLAAFNIFFPASRCTAG